MRHLLLGAALVAVVAFTLGQNAGTRPAPAPAAPSAVLVVVTSAPSPEPTGEIGEPLTGVNPSLIIPACQEDEVVWGYGDFSDGYWSTYRCTAFEEIERDILANQP